MANGVAKLSFFVCLLLAVSGCERARVQRGVKAETPPGGADSQRRPAPSSGEYGPPRKLASLEESAVKESSGIVASRTTPGLYWTHNDSGDGPFLYAFDNRGRRQGTWRVTGATARDWEDIAVGPGPARGASYLYIGDIGDNRGLREEIKVYRVREPLVTPADASSSKANPVATENAEAIRLRYPDGDYNAEALLVHPRSGNIYIVTKIPLGDPLIYEALGPMVTSELITMKRVASLSLPGFFGGLITGGDISPDGLRVALCNYDQGYELVLPEASTPFNEVWKQTLISIGLGERKQGEAIGYRLDGRALLATSEGKRAPLIQVLRR